MLKPFTIMSIIALMIFIFITSVKANIYYWTDEKGIKHFSNISPPSDIYAVMFKENVSKLLNSSNTGKLFTVTKVFDGDTIAIKWRNLELKIRLVGIDAPEIGYKKSRGQPYSQQAKNWLTRLINKRKIAVKSYGLGNFNRILAEIFIEKNINVNLEMIKAGLAEVYRGKKPKDLNSAAYLRMEKEARIEKKGIWSQKQYISPQTWRRQHPFKKAN